MKIKEKSQKAQKDFEDLVKQEGWKFGENYKYTTALTKVSLICNKGHIADKRPNDFQQGNRCRICSRRDPKTAQKEFEYLVKHENWKFGENYKYINARTKVSLICNKDHIANKTPDKFKTGDRCKICAGLDSKIAEKEFAELVLKENWKFGKNYKYINAHIIVPLICNKGHIADKTPKDFKNGYRCGKCINKTEGKLQNCKIGLNQTD